MSNIDRRKFVKIATLGSFSFPFASLSLSTPRETSKIRIGLIGLGRRGNVHLSNLSKRNDVVLAAICDINKEKALAGKRNLINNGLSEPKLYTRGEYDYKRMISEMNLDGVIIATPWKWHVPMAVTAMKSGCYAGVEVPAAITLDGCWELVKISEQTGVPCMILENVCYSRDVLAILNMVRKGIFGELVHARCGYQHNMNDSNFDENGNFGDHTEGVSSWRTEHYLKRNGDLYPTHGIGPVAHWMDINRGNRFINIASTSTKSIGFHNYIKKIGGNNHPNTEINFREGDIVTSTITTAKEESIIVTHDTSLPRPYSLGFRCQGANGIWNAENNSIYLEEISPKLNEWESFERYQKKYDVPMWTNRRSQDYYSSHNKRDNLLLNDFIESIKHQSPPPIDVYDAATWSAIGPLSENSIALGGQPVSFPDFTNGKWIKNERIFTIE